MIAQPHQLNAVGDHADQRPVAATDQRSIPEATVARLATYLRALIGLGEHGVATVSSESLATAAGVNSAKLRKDLSYLGSYGVRGVGYEVSVLTEQIHKTLGLHQHRAVALIGLGHLGQALAGYAGFASRGFQISALSTPTRPWSATRLRGLTVRHVDCLDEVVQRAQHRDRRGRDSGRRGAGRLRPAGGGRRDHDPQLRADGAERAAAMSTCARSTWQPSCRSCPSMSNRKAGRADCLPATAGSATATSAAESISKVAVAR